MPFYSHFHNVAIFPHVLSKCDEITKEKYKKKYKFFKQSVAYSSMGAITVTEGAQLAKDVINSKLKAYGYNSLFAIILGPFVSTLAVPLYVLSAGTKFQKYAIMVADLGAFFTRSEVRVINWAFLIPDIAFFGEPVPIASKSTGMILRNETSENACRFVETLGGLTDVE